MSQNNVSGKAVVESVISVASRLIAVLEQEIELLQAMKARDIAGLQEEKMRLVKSYEDQVRALAEQPALLQEVAPALRAEFAVLAERFEQVMTENRQRLTAANAAQRRFFDAVIHAAEEKQANLKTYSAGGSYGPAPGDKSARQRPLSLTLDRQL